MQSLRTRTVILARVHVGMHATDIESGWAYRVIEQLARASKVQVEERNAAYIELHVHIQSDADIPSPHSPHLG